MAPKRRLQPRTLNDYFEDFSTLELSLGASPDRIKELRKAFYSGALLVTNLMLDPNNKDPVGQVLAIQEEIAELFRDSDAH